MRAQAWVQKSPHGFGANISAMETSPAVRAVRGATTVEADTPETITVRVQELLLTLMERNNLHLDDIISVIFTATQDLTSMFPATASREIGFGDVPLLCAAEIPVPGSMPKCVRVMVHTYTHLSRTQLRHTYLHGARVLRDDLPG
jgi:chorismate mutase